jgi:hypothetical protein
MTRSWKLRCQRRRPAARAAARFERPDDRNPRARRPFTNLAGR